MKKTLITVLIAVLGINFSLFAQEKAITETGDTIYVYPDGTWSFELELYKPSGGITQPINKRVAPVNNGRTFTVTEGLTGKLSSALGPIRVMYQDSIYKRLPPANINGEAEFALTARDNSCYAMVIIEPVEIGLDNLFKIALTTMESAADEPLEILEQEYCEVNGQPMIRASMKATVNGLEIIYFSNYYSGPNGSVQLVSWSFASLFDQQKPKLEALLNGLVID
jgi:hypothetical protein